MTISRETLALDPYETARRHADERCMKLVAKVMKACGVTQVDISRVELEATDKIAILDDREFLRIKGTFQLEDKL